jgi:lysophospholipase L1-like esterase
MKLQRMIALGMFGGGVTPYYQRVMATTPIAYWALDDLTGVAAVDRMALGNGTYKNTAGTLSGVTLGQTGIGDGLTSAAFTGSYCNIYSAALNTAFTPAECSMMTWIQVTEAGVWSDTTNRHALTIRADVSNRLVLLKTTTNNTLQALYVAGGTSKNVAYTPDAPLTWLCLATTVSVSGDVLRFFVNGAEVGTAATGLGTWTGVLASTANTIAAANTSSASPWTGNLAHAAVWSRVLTPAEVASISSPFDSSSSLYYLLTVGDSKTGGTGDTGYTPGGYQPPLCVLLHTANGQHWSENPPRIGVGGLDMAALEARTAADIAGMTATPNEILINMGANDVGAGYNKAAWKASYIAVIGAYHTAFPSANIRLAKIWVRDTGTQAAAIALQNEAIDEMYVTYSWLATGINEALFLPGEDDGATYTTDGTHPNHAGYLLEAAAWKTAITGS